APTEVEGTVRGSRPSRPKDWAQNRAAKRLPRQPRCCSQIRTRQWLCRRTLPISTWLFFPLPPPSIAGYRSAQLKKFAQAAQAIYRGRAPRLDAEAHDGSPRTPPDYAARIDFTRLASSGLRLR